MGSFLETHEEHPDSDELGVWDFDSYGIRLRRRDGIPAGSLDRDRIKTWSQGGEVHAPIGAGRIQVSVEQVAAIVPQLQDRARNRALLIENPYSDGSKPEVICPGEEAGALVAAACAQPNDPKKEETKAKEAFA